MIQTQRTISGIANWTVAGWEWLRKGIREEVVATLQSENGKKFEPKKELSEETTFALYDQVPLE